MKKDKIYVNKKNNSIKGPCGVTLKSYNLSQIAGTINKSLDNFYSDMIYSSDKLYTEIAEQFLCFANGELLAGMQYIKKNKYTKIPIENAFKKTTSKKNKKKFSLNEDLKDLLKNFSITNLLIIEISKLKINEKRLKKIFPIKYIKLVPQILFFGVWQRILSENCPTSFLYCCADIFSQTLRNLYEKKLGFSPNKYLIYYGKENSSKMYTLYRNKCEKEIINGHLSLRNNTYLKNFFNSYEIIEL